MPPAASTGGIANRTCNIPDIDENELRLNQPSNYLRSLGQPRAPDRLPPRLLAPACGAQLT